MNMNCLRCGSTNVNAELPCPYCGLIRFVSVQTLRSQPLPSMASHPMPRRTATEEPGIILPILAPGTSLDKGHYLLLEMGSVQQWGSTLVETHWRAQEIEPETQRQRYITIADITLPTYHQRQTVSQAARRAFMNSGLPLLLNTFMEQDHCFFVFASTC